MDWQLMIGINFNQHDSKGMQAPLRNCLLRGVSAEGLASNIKRLAFRTWGG
jgi:hypothetical protein